jgi:hypothetical protein
MLDKADASAKQNLNYPNAIKQIDSWISGMGRH